MQVGLISGVVTVAAVTSTCLCINSCFLAVVVHGIHCLNFILVRFFFKTRIRFGMSLVLFGSKNAVQFDYYSYLLLV